MVWILTLAVLVFGVPVAPANAQLVCRGSLACSSAAVVDAAQQILERDCPCATQRSVKQYRRCARQALRTARQELGAAFTPACASDVKTAVSNSTCGRSGFVVCNKRNRKNTKTTCAVVKADRCRGSACGAFTDCLDACNSTAQACRTTTTTTTLPGGGGSTTTTIAMSTTTTTAGGGGSTTTTIMTTTTTIGGGGSTSTTMMTTTTTLAGGVTCSIATAGCTETSCTCGPDPGVDYHIGATGSVSGPVDTQLRVNINALGGGTIDCGGWTRIFGSDVTGCDILGCCRRDDGQPETVQWGVFEVIDLPCYCPMASDPGALQHNFVAQCQLPPAPVMEVNQTSTGCG